MGNSASYDGGGIRCGNESNPTIINCTIYGNSADVIGGGIACWYSNITGVNNIIWANSAPADSQIYIDPGSSSTCTYSDIQGGYAGTGNIDSDPLFVNGPCGDCYLSQIASGQAVNSPCVDTGDPASPMIVGTTRTDGVQDAGVIDMGYHYSLNLSFPQIVITLTPTNPPIQIPANGGMFEFNVEMANNEASAVTFDVWTLVTLPNGSEYGPVIGPLELTLNPGVSVDRDRTQNVPAGAPSGDYTYDAYVGIYPYFVWDEDHIDFEKLADSDNGSFVSNWENWGESFEGFAENSSLTTPDDYTVLTACPNPFNPTTAISYKLQAASFVNLTIFDITGREVARLVDGYRSAGMHNVAFDGADLSSGIYFARLNAGSFTQTQKLLLVK